MFLFKTFIRVTMYQQNSVSREIIFLTFPKIEVFSTFSFFQKKNSAVLDFFSSERKQNKTKLNFASFFPPVIESPRRSEAAFGRCCPTCRCCHRCQFCPVAFQRSSFVGRRRKNFEVHLFCISRKWGGGGLL